MQGRMFFRLGGRGRRRGRNQGALVERRSAYLYLTIMEVGAVVVRMSPCLEASVWLYSDPEVNP